MNKPIRVLIVDDEPLACRKLHRLLSPDPQLELFSANNGKEALQILSNVDPQILLLDVQMPDISGFELLDQIPVEKMPYVIFVTAYDRYAIEAFEVRAIDYLLKPFSPERLQQAMERAKSEALEDQEKTSRQKVLNLIEQEIQVHYLQRLIVKERERVFFIPCSKIDWIEAAGKYARIHIGKDNHLFGKGLKHLEPKLDPAKFVRIHKSAVVNIDSIQQLQSWFHGDYRVLLRDGTKLMLSRRYKKKLEHSLGDTL